MNDAALCWSGPGGGSGRGRGARVVPYSRPKVRVGSWHALGAAAGGVRMAVFVAEQGIAAALEIDGRDATAIHVVAFDAGGLALATGRLLPDAHIGRMAVLREHRGRGLGSIILRSLLALALNRGMHEVRLKAQVSALGFYVRAGFAPQGAPFEEAGLSHQAMVRALPMA